MLRINEIQDAVIEEFEVLEDWMDKYQLIIDLGGELPELEERFKTPENLIDGCQSRVWLVCTMEEGRMLL